MKKKTREEAIEELSLMLMYLTRFSDDDEYCRYMEMAWKRAYLPAEIIQGLFEVCLSDRERKGESQGSFGGIWPGGSGAL